MAAGIGRVATMAVVTGMWACSGCGARYLGNAGLRRWLRARQSRPIETKAEMIEL